ncbi:helix-turn-helix domain-containing protein [Roseomonas sp. E05]|uniref:helix-turn-helix domain-containing protein n=1 Tax=Roseomonas sp. E05 TaxID=3046310 RepID=UPI0024BB3AA9|nr:helix-turn-helix domain-containing protein [Roseomonas sp. E05]MDJ0391640.1 helix-turn-helix domain-containing protein [Roseomonas sp. E05]
MLDPIHLEPLFTRSHKHNWTIRPHRHRRLHQIFWIQRGEGVVDAQGRSLPFEAPMLLIVPPGEVHGFRFEPQSRGYVLTITDAFFGACCALAGERGYPQTVFMVPVGTRAALQQTLNGTFFNLEQEFRQDGIGRGTALAGYVLAILGQVQRGMEAEAAAHQPRSQQEELVARFREQVEENLTGHAALGKYCAQLGITLSTLTRACRAVTGRSPLELIHDRLMLEARRLLSYSSLSISEIAYSLGFEPAYFSRFFSKREGLSPAAFQRAALLKESK